MKRLFLFFSVLAIAATSNAQFSIEPAVTLSDSGSKIYVIPKDFSKSNTPLLIPPSSIEIYDDNLNLIKSFNISEFPWPSGEGIQIQTFDFIDLDQNFSYHGMSPSSAYTIYLNEFYFTQTLFNDDEKFEFVAYKRKEGESKKFDYYVYNEDGELLAEFEIEGYLRTITKLGGNYYFTTTNPCNFYKINRTSSSGINAPKVSQSTGKSAMRYYDITGKKVDPNAAKGKIVIKTDGSSAEKVVMK